jgi:hypothetical protein
MDVKAVLRIAYSNKKWHSERQYYNVKFFFSPAFIKPSGVLSASMR